MKFLRESINGFQQDSFVHDICKIRIIILAKLTGVLEILNGAFSKTKISVWKKKKKKIKLFYRSKLFELNIVKLSPMKCLEFLGVMATIVA